MRNFEDEFVLPEDWYVEIPNDLKNKILLNNWKIKQKYNNDLFENPQYKYVQYEGAGWRWFDVMAGCLITFDQFKQYVLKQNNITNNMKNKKLIGYKLIKRIPGLQVGAVFTSKVNNEWIFEAYEYNNEEIQDTEFFEPVYVYEYEFKIGDWIVWKLNGNIYQLKKLDIVNNKLIGGWDTRGHYRNFKGNDYRLAIKEEIEKATEQVISMNGKFNLTIRNKKVYHKSEDITNFVLDIGQDYGDRKCFINIYRGYDFHIKDVILSKTGCESQETYLSDWLKVYELIK